MNGAWCVAISNDYAYVGFVNRAGLAVIDISTPTSPVWVADANIANPDIVLGAVRSIDVSSGYAYAACVSRDSLAVIA